MEPETVFVVRKSRIFIALAEEIQSAAVYGSFPRNGDILDFVAKKKMSAAPFLDIVPEVFGERIVAVVVFAARTALEDSTLLQSQFDMGAKPLCSRSAITGRHDHYTTARRPGRIKGLLNGDRRSFPRLSPEVADVEIRDRCHTRRSRRHGKHCGKDSHFHKSASLAVSDMFHLVPFLSGSLSRYL
jgi:hypothetical protein